MSEMLGANSVGEPQKQTLDQEIVQGNYLFSRDIDRALENYQESIDIMNRRIGYLRRHEENREIFQQESRELDQERRDAHNSAARALFGEDIIPRKIEGETADDSLTRGRQAVTEFMPAFLRFQEMKKRRLARKQSSTNTPRE